MGPAWEAFITRQAAAAGDELPAWIEALGQAADEVLDRARAQDRGLAAWESIAGLNALTERQAQRHGALIERMRLSGFGPLRAAGTLGVPRGRVLL